MVKDVPDFIEMALRSDQIRALADLARDGLKYRDLKKQMAQSIINQSMDMSSMGYVVLECAHPRAQFTHALNIGPDQIQIHRICPDCGQKFYGRADYFKQAYYDPATLQLDDEQRATLKKSALLTRWQAAERLGVDPKKFDKLKKGRIEAADSYPTNSGYLGYLYRQEDVDSLKDYI